VLNIDNYPTIPLPRFRDDYPAARYKIEAGLLIVIPSYAGQDQNIIPFVPDDFFWVTKASPV
jgi:hypothetical protein